MTGVQTCALPILTKAASIGNLGAVKVILDHGAAVDRPLPDGATALFAAAYGGHLDVVQFLISKRAKADVRTVDGQSPAMVAALAVAGLVNSYWVMVAMFALMGVGNTVYHPADYSLLSRHVAAERVSQAYSIHTFSGLLGSAAAPGTILFMHSLFGWRGAFIGAGILGLVIAVGVLLQGDPAYDEQPTKKKEDEKSGADWKLLLSPPILISFVFFMLLSFSNFGLQNFSVVALGALYGTAPSAANTALSANLAFAAWHS